MTSRLRVVRALGDMKALREPWRALEEVARTPLLSYDYVESFIEAYADDPNMRIAVLEDGNALRAAAPLRRTSRFGMDWLEFFDQPVQEVHAGFLSDSDGSAQELCRQIVNLGMPLNLIRIPLTSPVVPAFAGLAKDGRCICREVEGISTASVTFGPGEIEEIMSPSGLKRLRRSERKAEAAGSIAFSFHKPGVEDVGRLMDVFVNVEAASWKGAAGTSLRDDQPMRAFFSEVARRAARRGELFVAIMTVDGKPAAVRVATSRFGSLWDHKIGYSEEFAAVAPGLVLTQATLKASKSMGNTGHVFLGNHEEWQDRWQPLVTPTRTIKVFPFSMRGLAAFALEAAAYSVRRMRRTHD